MVYMCSCRPQLYEYHYNIMEQIFNKRCYSSPSHYNLITEESENEPKPVLVCAESSAIKLVKLPCTEIEMPQSPKMLHISLTTHMKVIGQKHIGSNFNFT